MTACNSTPPGVADETEPRALAAPAVAASAPEPEHAQCASMRRIEAADVVRVEGDRVFFLNEYRGVTVFDVADVDHPRPIGHSAIMGTPVALFVRGDDAIAVLTDWEGSAFGGSFRGSVVRAVEARRAGVLATKSEIALPGVVRDAAMIDDVLFLLRERRGPRGEETVVQSLRLVGGALRTRGEIVLPGANGAFTVDATRIVIARRLPAPATESEMTILDVGADPSSPLSIVGSVRVPGLVPYDARFAIAALDELVYVVACSEDACGASEPYVLSVVDTRDPEQPRAVGRLRIPALGGWLVTAFDADRVYVAGDRGYARATGPTDVHVVDLSDATRPVLAGTIAVPGSVSSIVPVGDHALAMGAIGSIDRRMHVVVHDIDVGLPARPRLTGSAAFGEDVTWSLALDQRAAVGVDDTMRFAALPFSTWDEASKRYANGVQLLRRTPRGLALAGSATTSGWVERVLFVGGRMVAVSDDGLTVASIDGAFGPKVVWPPGPSDVLRP